MPVVARKVSDGKKRAISVKEEEEKEKKKKESSSIRSSSKSSSYFDSIPDHLKEEIFLRVGGSGKSEIGNIQLTSKSFYKVTNSSERFWKTMCEKEVGEEGAIVFREYHFHHHQDESIIRNTKNKTCGKELAWKKKYRMWCEGEGGIMSWGARSESSETTISNEPNWFPDQAENEEEEEDEHQQQQQVLKTEREKDNKFSPRYLHRATQCGKDLTKVILFGGQSSSGFHNDVFFLDMDEKKNPTRKVEKLHVCGKPPIPRCSGSIQTLRVFKSSNSSETRKEGKKLGGREVIALFGGSQGYITGFRDDILVLAPSVDSDISTALEKKSPKLTWYEPTIVEKNPVHGRPAPRWGHATFARNGKLLVFGGSNTNTCFNDFWECTLERTDEACPFAITATWKLLCRPAHRQQAYETMPCPRAGATLCVVNDVAYLFGGCRVSTTFNDLWKFDLSETSDMVWEKVQTTGITPTPRVGHSMVTIGNRLIIQGGRGMQPDSPLPGKMSTRGLAAMQGLVFYESGFSVLDLSKMNWLPRQYPKVAAKEEEEEEEDQNKGKDESLLLTTTTIEQQQQQQDSDDVNVREHRTGHVMMLAPQGIILIGGLGYNSRFQSDVQRVKLFF